MVITCSDQTALEKWVRALHCHLGLNGSAYSPARGEGAVHAAIPLQHGMFGLHDTNSSRCVALLWAAGASILPSWIHKYQHRQQETSLSGKQLLSALHKQASKLPWLQPFVSCAACAGRLWLTTLCCRRPSHSVSLGFRIWVEVPSNPNAHHHTITVSLRHRDCSTI